ncbi:MAG: DUF3105 domain-containing protein [Chloroflexi bacterium]|nr:DUF3105 domain-containing protein [Chloroflexota bacterium]
MAKAKKGGVRQDRGAPTASAKTSVRGSSRGNRASSAGQPDWGKYVRIGGPVVGVIALIALAIVVVPLLGSEPTPVGRLVPDQGTAHVLPGQPHPPYNSTPPTSGWHYETPAPWGVSDRPIDDETQIHNLEHGGIMIQYWCPEGCGDLVERLKAVVRRYPSKVTLAPYAKALPNRIALTAWRYIDTFDQFDEKRIVSFIDAHKNRGPERVPD